MAGRGEGTTAAKRLSFFTRGHVRRRRWCAAKFPPPPTPPRRSLRSRGEGREFSAKMQIVERIGFYRLRMPERGLQRLELLDAARELVTQFVVLGIGGVFPSILDLRGKPRQIDLIHRSRVVGKHGEALRADFGKAAVEGDALLRAALVDRENAGPQRRDQR